MALFNRRKGNADTDEQGHEPWLTRAATGVSATFDEVEFVGGYAVLRWETEHGGVGLAHFLRDGNGSTRMVIRDLQERYGRRTADRYACVVLAQAATQITEPHVPQLEAQDITGPNGGLPDPYQPTWEQLAAALDTRPPYWHATLRDRDAIAAWRPGSPPAVVPACHVTNPVTPLTELAADEPDGSPAAELCWSLAREIRRRDHAYAADDIEELRENAAASGDGAHLVLGAVPAPLRREKEDEPSEMVRRAGWLAITERRDVLAHRVADLAQRWDGGADWHTGHTVTIDPEACATAAEWMQRLEPIERGKAPTVLEKLLLDNAHDIEVDQLLHDPVTGVPALRRAERPHREDGDVFTYALQRLPTISPLASITVSEGTCWIRTEDDTLWFAPAREGYGVSWGYRGTGNATFAKLLDRLLDDISAPAIRPHDPDAPDGLFDLLRTTPQKGSTTYTRAQLLTARTA